MHALKNLIAAAAFCASAPLASAPFPSGTFELDAAHSKIGFEVSHMVIATVSGQFSKAQATLTLDADASKSKVSATIDVASVTTGVDKRDEHLRSADFFDATKYPSITFKSTSFRLDGSKLTVTGDLSIHGTTQAVTLEGVYKGSIPDDGWGNQRVAAHLSTVISRKKFNILWNKVIESGPVVGDDVTLVLDIEASRPNKKGN
jgi:polyisoprenoid-binding protein YceI